MSDQRHPAPAFARPTKGGVLLSVRLQPGAARSEVAGVQGDALRLRIAAPPVDGRANDAARDFLAERLGVPRSAIVLTRGATARHKLFFVQGLTVEAVRDRLCRP
ncbi:MAG: DUF167 domain-containing protein [Firmicutes bacterium]|uniref:UPF0235 protein VLY81_05600 n=1 Tax=Geochorda subterranea TaxID=3109564 RepID=A0ABZ1BU51_9FIRM|nr:DUF167 domain-containing protein [Limnochorda sp. LNt]NLG67997.1 DUF167 domain-containing protein [Bacillota bacterium]WRP15637.1 DUF167 domain-containing protein [Limnochorda sp. LNt]